MAKTVVRTIEAYSIHGHVNAGDPDASLLDYRQFFARLSDLDTRDLRISLGSDTVAVSDIRPNAESVAIRFIAGNSEEYPLVYDATTATTESVDLGENRIVVNGVWAVVFPERRLLLAERKRPGVPINQIEKFLSKIGRDKLGLSQLTVSLNPVASQSFEEEVAKFTRIREASITLRRPNLSWTESAKSLLGETAESNAAEIQLQLNADRGQSLAKDRGVVQEVIALARQPINALKNAVIKGKTPEFEGERSVSLTKHLVKGSTRVDPRAAPLAQLEPILTLADELSGRIPASADTD